MARIGTDGPTITRNRSRITPSGSSSAVPIAAPCSDRNTPSTGSAARSPRSSSSTTSVKNPCSTGPLAPTIAHMSGSACHGPDAFIASTKPVSVNGARGCSPFQSASSSAPFAMKFAANSSRVATGERPFDSSMKPPTAMRGTAMTVCKNMQTPF